MGLTMAQSALIAANSGHMDHYEKAMRYAIKTAETVRRFLGEVDDSKAKADIGERLAELDKLISVI
jgi:hypothetical protein